ncbi:hypothetical protein GEOBRER4_n1714 [Citrifermentans bremense]|uniref:Uncharacterized protein n=1 Tax=Citrifermentans bremense TaxID=60035 RepID=A0A6S6LZZ5_9BACT|nr:hypothetical protein [Citrifermentans bremense]BCG46898.1 hypothetical protein GEOBRER4_n1714 [Citrifermentans bremense]
MHRRLALDEHVSENNNTVALLQAEAKELVGKDTLEYNRRCASLVVDLNVRDAVISERSGEAGGLSATASAAPPADK